MVDTAIRWWREIGWQDWRKKGLRCWGIRPWGKRWFLFVIDDTDTATKKVDRGNLVHDFRCGECGGAMDSHVITSRHSAGPCDESYTGPEVDWATPKRRIAP